MLEVVFPDTKEKPRTRPSPVTEPKDTVEAARMEALGLKTPDTVAGLYELTAQTHEDVTSLREQIKAIDKKNKALEDLSPNKALQEEVIALRHSFPDTTDKELLAFILKRAQ